MIVLKWRCLLVTTATLIILRSCSDYFMAFELVSALIEEDADAIRKIRKTNPLINSVILEDFHAAGLEISDDLANRLTQPFSEL